MTPDKIKEAFVAKFKEYTTEGDSWDYANREIGWQACAEWMMSRASEGFDEYLENLESEGGCLNDSWGGHKETFQAARLSSAKEIAEKDARIAELTKLRAALDDAIEVIESISEHDEGCIGAYPGREIQCTNCIMNIKKEFLSKHKELIKGET